MLTQAASWTGRALWHIEEVAKIGNHHRAAQYRDRRAAGGPALSVKHALAAGPRTHTHAVQSGPDTACRAPLLAKSPRITVDRCGFPRWRSTHGDAQMKRSVAGSSAHLQNRQRAKVVAGSRQEFDQTVDEYAAALATRDDYDGLLEAKCAGRAEDERRRPLDTYRVRELTEMSRDIYDDRHNFAAMRRAFVTKQPPRGPAVSAPSLADRGRGHARRKTRCSARSQLGA